MHVSTTYELVLDSGHLCIFKPGDGLLEAAANGLYLGKQALRQYGHTPVSTTISECAAWQLAKQLGAPWHELVVPTVMKFPRHPESGAQMVGAASVFRGGAVAKRGFYEAVPDQVSAGGFFDALIGQQDRNKGNVLWYEERHVIYLIDHSFSFARTRWKSRLIRPRAVALEPGLAPRGGRRTRRLGEAARVDRSADVAPLSRSGAR